MPLTHLGDLLKSRARRAPYARCLSASRVTAAVRAWVTATWDHDVGSSIRVCYVRDGILFLGVASASCAEAIRWREGELRAHLHASAPNLTIVGTRVFVSG